MGFWVKAQATFDAWTKGRPWRDIGGSVYDLNERVHVEPSDEAIELIDELGLTPQQLEDLYQNNAARILNVKV